MGSRSDNGCIGYIVLLLVAVWLLGAVLNWIAANARVIVATCAIAAAIVGLTALAMLFHKRRRDRLAAEAQRLTAEEQAEQDRRRLEGERAQARRYRAKLDALIAASDRVYLDTNVWMNAEYVPNLELLLEALAAQERRIGIHERAFDEIVNLKDTGGRIRAFRGRSALRLIEDWQKRGTLHVVPTPGDGARWHYDRVLLRLVTEDRKAGRRVLVATDDRELRIRLRELARTGGANCGLEVISGADLDLACHRSTEFVEAFRDAHPQASRGTANTA